MYRLIVASPSRRTTNHPWKGCGYVTWHVLNFGGPIHISGMAEARALKLCTNGDYIKSGQRDDKSPLKGACFFSTTTDYWLSYLRHLRPHWGLGLSSIGSICHCICCKAGCITYRQQIKWSLSNFGVRCISTPIVNWILHIMMPLDSYCRNLDGAASASQLFVNNNVSSFAANIRKLVYSLWRSLNASNNVLVSTARYDLLVKSSIFRR